MEFDMDGLLVDFPYPQIYPEQYAYMLEIKRALDAKGHALLEMPTGTGKTVSMLSLITSYQRKHPEVGKLVYCTRTVPEMEKVLQELQHLERFRDGLRGSGRPHRLLAVGLSSRRNLCIHDKVAQESERESVDTKCRSLTASWVRARAAAKHDVETCPFFEALEAHGTDSALPHGVHTLDELKELARARGWCPYFLARHAISFADVVVYNYQYLLDPKISGLISSSLRRESIVVFDEAHNIDNVCIEVMSINFREATLQACERNVGRLYADVARLKRVDAQRLNREYQALVHGLATSGALPAGARTDELRANPVLPESMLSEAVPGNIRRAEHFVTFLQRVVRHVKGRLERCRDEGSSVVEKPARFLAGLQQDANVDAKALKFASERLRSLLRTLEVTNVQEFQPLTLVAEFATMCATYEAGFTVLLEPSDDRTPSLPDPVMQLCCLDASIAIKHVFERFQSVVITSGTLSPIELYPKLLRFRPCVVRTLTMSLRRDCICPLVVCRAADQTVLSTRFETRSEEATVRAYGELLIQMAESVPDGLVAFFPSYLYMEEVIRMWADRPNAARRPTSGGAPPAPQSRRLPSVLDRVLEHKLVYIETPDIVETTLALENYKRACDCGRGAVFLSVARGKVAEGVDFDRHYGRAVLLLGVPFQYTRSRPLIARLEYLSEACQVSEADFITFDAMRQAAQCAGRVIRGKTDYGLIIFADARYNRPDKRNKLPQWIRQHLGDEHLNLSTDMGVLISRRFLKRMAQPVSDEDQQAVALSLADLRDPVRIREAIAKTVVS
ncbi:hypothetical protein KFE25_006086 [Diacronema lutheri]|uniref:DNA 5'-3' helicase n=1 Tax=Diacronema lutheri TaxID=2081491 RepID=A0A8J5XIF2_DIALT|nr:hypothetical protein KFE25_006086 [Diacronema lutheri]